MPFRYLKAMGFLFRMGGLVGAALLGFGAVGCGQVSGTNGGDGAREPGNNGLPAATDRFAFAKSGERLLALGYESEGVSQFRTFHDEQFDFDCEFVSARSGDDSLCVPKRKSSLIFLDSSCSEPATWILDFPVHVGQWLSVGSSSYDSRLPHRDTFELGEQVYPETTSGSPPPVYSLQGTTCSPASPPAKGFPAVNRLIPHADSELVTAKPTSLDAGGGLRLTRLIGEDGSEFTLAVVTADGAVCTIQADGSCASTREEAARFPVTQRVRLGSGGAHVDLFNSMPSAGHAGLPVAHYPVAFDFLDQMGDRCQVVPAADGTLRCATLEPAAYESGAWADEACTQRLYYGAALGVDLPTPRTAFHAQDGRLAALFTVKVYDGPAYGIDNGVCAPNASVADLLQLDQRLDISSLPQVVETTL